MQKGHALIVLPAFNEGLKILSVIEGLKKIFDEDLHVDIVVIDDGSSDDTAKKALSTGIIVLSHPINLGPGAATSTGIEYAKMKNYEYMVTADADGQHSGNDVRQIVDTLREDKFDLLIGSRLEDMKKKRPSRYFFNQLSNILTFLICRKYVSDSQSGLKGLNRKALEVIRPKSIGYEICSEIVILAARNKLTIGEIPIDAIYTEYSLRKATKQSIGNSFRMVRKILLK